MTALLEELAAQKDTPEAPRADSHESIELCAYFRYVDRGFVDGFAVEDWLAAEAELRKENDRTPIQS